MADDNPVSDDQGDSAGLDADLIRRTASLLWICSIGYRC
jgi:hypothetical protein